MTLRVAIISQVRLYAEGILKLLEDDDEFLVVGMARNDDEIISLVQDDPDVVIVDLQSCQKALNIISSNKNKRVLLVSDANEVNSSHVKSMIANGLGGILTNDSGSQLLRKAIRKLNYGELWFDRQTIREVLSRQDEKAKDVQLTKKEAEILKHICTGLSNKEIATKLYISEQTVKSHCNHLFKKFGVSSRLKLAVRAPECYSEHMTGNHQPH